MKIALGQYDFHVGNFRENTDKIIASIQEARQAGADMVVFPELAVCGYPPRDFLEFNHFIELCQQSVDEIAAHCQGIACIVGSPSVNDAPKGKDLFNSAFFLADGQVKAVVHKALLPTYDVFDEYRYFEPGAEWQVIEYKGERIALTICEDLWNLGDNPLYREAPMEFLAPQRPTLAINIAASPFSFNQDARRTRIIQQNAAHYGIPFVYVNHTGAHTELIFDGGSMVAYPGGQVDKLPFFQELTAVYDIAQRQGDSHFSPDKGTDKYHLVYEALLEGIRDYFGKLCFQQAALGLSGGIDSAVVFALVVHALGRENVFPVLMPSPYSSEGSVSHALDMVGRLGTTHHILPIERVMKAFDDTLADTFEGRPHDITEENIQSRIRGTLLMALCNKFQYILLNTSNKSELAVGYSTLYGDSAGAISVLGDLYKTEVFELAHYINRHHGNPIPSEIVEKEPSAELRHDQKDSDSLPPYEVLDKVLFEYIERRMGPREIVASGVDPAFVLRVLRMVNRNEFKRHQTPPILRVSDKAFGLGRRLPIVAKYLE